MHSEPLERYASIYVNAGSLKIFEWMILFVGSILVQRFIYYL